MDTVRDLRAFLYSNREGSINYDTPGWGSLASGFLCCGPAFGVNANSSSSFARAPMERDGVPTSTVGVLDRSAGVIQAYTAGQPGDPVPVTPAAGLAPDSLPFSIGAGPDPDLNAYGGFEFFGAAVFDRPLRPAEAAVINAYFADPLRRPDVTVPPALRFVPRANA